MRWLALSYLDDETPVVQFDPLLEVSPFVLFRRLKGYPRVKALFGGLELYEFSLDPEVIGQETYLVRQT